MSKLLIKGDDLESNERRLKQLLHPVLFYIFNWHYLKPGSFGFVSGCVGHWFSLRSFSSGPGRACLFVSAVCAELVC